MRIIDPAELDGTKKDLEGIIKKWFKAKNDWRCWEYDEGKKYTDMKYRSNPYHPKQKSFYLLNSSRDKFKKEAFILPESLRDAEAKIPLYYSMRYRSENA